jgi:hypothetical protein
MHHQLAFRLAAFSLKRRQAPMVSISQSPLRQQYGCFSQHPLLKTALSITISLLSASISLAHPFDLSIFNLLKHR